MEKKSLGKKANLVLLSGILFNLSIGVLYSWSVVKSRLTAPIAEGGFEWTSSQAGLPYTIAIVFFALGVLLGGRIQDKIGPRKVVTVGGVLVGAGLMLASVVGNSVLGVSLTYGVLTGLGIGLGYGCVSPCALKWFHSSKKGMVSGLIVGGFGLAAVYLAPLTDALLNNFGISQTFLILGGATTMISVILAQFINNPEPGYVPEIPKNFVEKPGATGMVDVEWKEMLKSKAFYLLFIMFALSSSVGLMIIGNISKIAKIQDPANAIAYAALLVSLLAVFNTGGRVIGGILSDKIGRVNTMLVVFGIQGINMVLFSLFNNFILLVFGALLVGFAYGTLLSVFPSITADLYGLKNYGTNYGIMYLAWGLSGVIAPVMADYVYDLSGSFSLAYLICAGILVVCLGLGFVLKNTQKTPEIELELE
ncbi:MAG: L-lactate MFS transporter [Eubacteriaceae bacterium]